MKAETEDAVVTSRWRDRFVSLGVLLTLAGVFTYRGWDARNRLMYLDEIFVDIMERLSVMDETAASQASTPVAGDFVDGADVVAEEEEEEEKEEGDRAPHPRSPNVFR